nr:cytochrome c oxidase subunit 3 [Cylindrotaenia japonica]
MSILPIFNAFLGGILLLGLFSWNLWLLSVALICVAATIIFYLYDSMSVDLHYESAFWLFILSEVLVFGTLIFCCLYFDAWNYINLSSALELPFLGCFLLLGSSVTVTGFHHLLKWSHSWVLLLFTIMLGVAFIIMQICEMDEIIVCILDSSFHASSFCTVGLHFSHVILGVIGLVTMLAVGINTFGEYRCTILTWYWHFVDYVWLFVYTFVYIC